LDYSDNKAQYICDTTTVQTFDGSDVFKPANLRDTVYALK